MIRILIADDHAVVREGIKRILADTSDLIAVGEAGTGQEVLDGMTTQPCDVVLLDLSMPQTNGLEVLQELKQSYPQVPVLVFSVYPEQQYALRAFRVGAAGYLTKDSVADDLVGAIRKVARGGRHVSLTLAEHLAIGLAADAPHELHATLSDREYQVLIMIGAGKTVKEIAYALNLSVKTISTYRLRLLRKMHMKTNAELIHYTIRHQLVD